MSYIHSLPRINQTFFLATVVAFHSGHVWSQIWPGFVDETATRMPTDPGLNDPLISTADPDAKNYAWGDVDQDGDIDLVSVRKQPYDVAGRRRNVLFMNEGIAEGHSMNGVLVDRTSLFVTDATDGGLGFLDLTDDRDVALVDLNGDTWLDIVTTTTYGQGLPKTISHPRIYINKGEIGGIWQGYRYEDFRTPTLPMAPNFCAVAVGDVNNDGAPDLYHIEYNNTLEDRLWINDGSGSFSDQSNSMTFQMLESEFGVQAVIADMNGDGVNDVIKDRANGAPYRISIAYNDPTAPGFFNAFETVYTNSPYYVMVADLNNDGLLDIVLQDDGIDRYLLNQGNGVDGFADFISFAFPPQSNGFSGTMELADLNRDGFADVIIADETVNVFGNLCSDLMMIWRNMGDVPNVTFSDESAGIPLASRTGVFDVAPFDINGDGWDDLVIGSCSGTKVWINQPPVGLAFSYPDGLPTIVNPNATFPLRVSLAGIGAEPAPGSGALFVSINGGPYQMTALTEIGPNLFEAELLASSCLDVIRFYLSADLVNTIGTFTDPPDAPNTTYTTIVATNTAVLYEDNVEADTSEWTVLNENLTAGAWEAATPNGTIHNAQLAAPDQDAESTVGNTMAFVTQNGLLGGNAASDDVDGGPTHLMSPLINLLDADATVSLFRWFFSSGLDDTMTISIANDGDLPVPTWIVVDSINQSTAGWESFSFLVSDFITPTANIRVRFSIADQPNNSVVEGGIDLLTVEQFLCAAPCPGDLNSSGTIDVTDLLIVLGQWGMCPGKCAPGGGATCKADTNDDCNVSVTDLLAVLGAWGTCP